MQTNIIWAGIEYHSTENCLINTTDRGTTIQSVITGLYEGKIYKVEYEILVNSHWQTTQVEIYARHSNRELEIILNGNSSGEWHMNGERTYEFNGCLDVDIPVTPFTNTLPINRLQLKENETKEVSVIYLDMLAFDVRTVKQLYRKVSAHAYQYENIPKDFEAEIKVDDKGLVIDYPQLFQRSACMESAYRI
jgi:uncharacterized protein